MSTFTNYRLQNRRLGPQKTCTDCGETIPANLTFCPNCGRDMRSIPENVRTLTESRTQFQIPAFLLAAPDSRRFDEEGIGTGIIWVPTAIYLLATGSIDANIVPASFIRPRRASASALEMRICATG